MRTRLVAVAALVASPFFMSGAHAAQCAGTPAFADVVASDFFCTDTEWLKNRAVTLGCGGAFYCPGEFVTRGQMASFMQRLGTVLIGEPRTNDIASGALALTGNALNNPICPITTIPPAGYARTLVVTAHASFVMSTTPGGRGDIGIHIINTVDGNTNNYSIASVNPQRTSADPLFHTSVSHGAVIVMAAGQAVKVAIGAFALPGGGPNTNVAGHACQITVTPYSRTGNSTPFDE